uniref:Heme binding protein 2 n=1 Tax=Lepisosteus oculatus TaxID=7918 RepID=W5NFM0_LEPOC
MLKTFQQALFSTGLQLPPWKPVECKAQDYEIRTYETTKWASTSGSGMQYDSAINTGFMRLFNYIQGNNEKIYLIPMHKRNATHVLFEWIAVLLLSLQSPSYLNDPNCPPKSKDPRYFLTTYLKLKFHLRTYGGFSNEQKSREELLKLSESLRRDGHQFVDKEYYTAGYDSPFKLVNRRNEVWLKKKTDED